MPWVSDVMTIQECSEYSFQSVFAVKLVFMLVFLEITEILFSFRIMSSWLCSFVQNTVDSSRVQRDIILNKLRIG